MIPRRPSPPSFLLALCVSPSLSPLLKFKPCSIKLWINCLIIPYNITATPNLANTPQPGLIQFCAAFPLCYLWDRADKWQPCLSANPQPPARQGVCVCVWECVCLARKKNRWGTRGDGGERWQDICFLIGWSEHPAELWIFFFLTEKNVFFDHVAQQTMKSSIFSYCTSTHPVFLLIKSVV